MEASIPDDKRWIPTGLNISYLKKTKTDLRAVCTLGDVNWEEVKDLDLEVELFDLDNDVVAKATVPMRIGDKLI